MICSVCLEQLEQFYAYKGKLVLTLQFMEGLIDLKNSNSLTLSALFKKSKRDLIALFNDLALCNDEEPCFEDLLEEFRTYDFAEYSEEVTIKQETLYLDFMTQMEDEDDVDADPDYMSGDEGKDSGTDSNQPMVPAVKTEFRTTKKKGDKTVKQEVQVNDTSEESTGPKRRGRKRIHPNGKFLTEPWSCDKCVFTTKYRSRVDPHKAVHERRENRVYPCAECDMVFKTKKERKKHITLHPENQVVCEICGSSLRTAHSLKTHMQRHEDTNKYSCEYCEYTAKTQHAVTAHMHTHTKNNFTKRCEICGVTFGKNTLLRRHMESHGNERKYACDQCPGRYNTANALRNHHKVVHLYIRHSCDHCDKTFDQKLNLRDHIERDHHIQCNFVCDICVTVFDSQQKLDAHKLRHSNPKPLECSVCLTLHLTSEAYAEHLCITYQQDYQCCGKDHRNHTLYNKHMMLKHDIKINARVKLIPGMLLGEVRGSRKRLIQCRKCDIAFPSKAEKMKHMAICNQQEGDIDSVSSF